MTRQELIEQLRRQVYGDFPVDESSITDNLVNQYISQGAAIAAKKNYTDNYQLEGVGFVNNSFYTTFKALTISQDEQFLYKWELPHLPLGIGSVDGISRIRFKDSSNNISMEGVLLSENQLSFARNMRPVPNKVLCYPEGVFGFAITTIIMTDFTAMVTMISGGDSTNLNSYLNIPQDYIPIIVEYVKAQILFERQQPVDAQNDGQSAVRTI